jgi:hypothetical protein
VKKNLKNFLQISVREKSLQDYLQTHSGTFIHHVLDPVFLLTKKDWHQIIRSAESLRKLPKKQYLLFYHLVPCAKAKEVSEIICKKNNYQLIEIFGGDRPYNFFNNYYQSSGPLDFINLINNAEYVVSTSFHGVAFSILFEKQFYSLGMDDNSSRVKSLLSLFDISERYLE